MLDKANKGSTMGSKRKGSTGTAKGKEKKNMYVRSAQRN